MLYVLLFVFLTILSSKIDLNLKHERLMHLKTSMLFTNIFNLILPLCTFFLSISKNAHKGDKKCSFLKLYAQKHNKSAKDSK